MTRKVSAVVHANPTGYDVDLVICDTDTGDSDVFRSYPTTETFDEICAYLRETYFKTIEVTHA